MPQTARACPNCRTPLPTYAAFCYACGAATPAGIDRNTGEYVVPETTGISMDEILPRLRRLLGPSYELGERIGSGGFAEVFLARDLRLKREVAIKVTRPDFAVNAQMMQRFRREAETVAALRHPHIMPIYDLGEAEGIAYIVMPYVRGESLAARLDRDGRLPVEQARAILLQAADALASAHEAGVVHRDVKPDNIMLDRREDQVLLMDFGIAKAIEGGSEITSLTSTGLVMGTPHYMSPEQAAGERNVDARADQYALGVIAYRMLAGSLPFDGPSVRAILTKQLGGAATPLRQAAPSAPPALVAAIERAMAKEPDDRYPSVRAFVGAVRSDPAYAAEVLRTTGSVPPYTPQVAVPAQAPPARMSRWVPAAALVALGLTGGAVILSARNDEAPRAAGAPPAADTSGLVAVAAPAAADSLAPGVLPPTGDSLSGNVVPRIGLPDSLVKRLAADSALVRRARLTYGTPAADSFLVDVRRSRTRSCEQWLASGRLADAARVCAAQARLGNRTAMRTLGTMAERSGKLDSAAYWYGTVADRDPQAALGLARLLDDGKGVTADAARATSLIRTAADGGDVEAQRTTAERLMRGVGVPKNEAGAVEWYTRAGNGGDVPSMVMLGDLYRTGRAVRQSNEQAVSWYQRAAEGGDRNAQYELARAYERDRGVPKMEKSQRESLALEWHRKAAQRGHTGSIGELRKRGIPF
jgi:serine/threonine-protein kinase